MQSSINRGNKTREFGHDANAPCVIQTHGAFKWFAIRCSGDVFVCRYMSKPIALSVSGTERWVIINTEYEYGIETTPQMLVSIQVQNRSWSCSVWLLVCVFASVPLSHLWLVPLGEIETSISPPPFFVHRSRNFECFSHRNIKRERTCVLLRVVFTRRRRCQKLGEHFVRPGVMRVDVVSHTFFTLDSISVWFWLSDTRTGYWVSSFVSVIAIPAREFASSWDMIYCDLMQIWHHFIGTICQFRFGDLFPSFNRVPHTVDHSAVSSIL